MHPPYHIGDLLQPTASLSIYSRHCHLPQTLAESPLHHANFYWIIHCFLTEERCMWLLSRVISIESPQWHRSRQNRIPAHLSRFRIFCIAQDPTSTGDGKLIAEHFRKDSDCYTFGWISANVLFMCSHRRVLWGVSSAIITEDMGYKRQSNYFLVLRQ